MTLSTLINRPATIIRRLSSSSTDEFGNVIPGISSVATVAEIQQRVRVVDELDTAQVSEAEWVGFFLPGTVLATDDAVDVDGVGTFEVIGAPWPARNPRTQMESHVEATLKMVAGPEDAS